MAGSTGKRLTGIILFIIAAIGVASFLFLLFADAEGFDSVPGTNDLPGLALWAAIALGVVALVLVVLLLMRSYDKREREVESAEAFFIPQDEEEMLDFHEVGDESMDDVEATPAPADDGRLDRERVRPIDLAGVPLGSRAWGVTVVEGQAKVHSFNFPRENAKALYNNDYIPINAKGDKLKLRTLLAAPKGAFDDLVGDDPLSAPKKSAVSPVAQALAERKTPAKKAPAKKAPAPAPAKAKESAYTDYKGDNHDVIDIEGIGPVYAKRLHAIGVKTIARLCYEDAASLARSIQANEKSVRSWQTMAEFMKVKGIGPQYAEVLTRAGVAGLTDLKRRGAESIAGQINGYLEGLEVNVVGQKITPRRVEGWKTKAKAMRKVRQAIPEE